MDKILEGDHYALLEQWSDNEGVIMPDDLLEYVKQLEYSRGFLYAGNPPNKVVNKLRVHFPGLSVKQAKSRMADAIEYFYIDGDLKKEAYRQIHYNLQMQAAELIFRTSKTPQEMKLASDIWARAEQTKQLHIEDKEDLPKELFEKKFRIFSIDPSDLGLNEMPNRSELDKMIDQFNTEEEHKLRLRQDAGTMPKQIFDIHEQDKNDPETSK